MQSVITKNLDPFAATPTQGPVLFIAPGPELALDGPACTHIEERVSYMFTSLEFNKIYSCKRKVRGVILIYSH